MINQEVVFNILNLLETMEEGLVYIREKLNSLEVEETLPILVDFIHAFSTVEEAIIPSLEDLEENKILEKTENLKNKLNIMVEEYEKENGQKLSEIMEESLEPRFEEWKREIELIIRPYVIS